MNLSGSKATVASPDPEEVLKEANASLEGESRVRARQYPIQIAFNDNDPIEKRGDIRIIVGEGMALHEGRDEGIVLLEGQAPTQGFSAGANYADRY